MEKRKRSGNRWKSESWPSLRWPPPPSERLLGRESRVWSLVVLVCFLVFFLYVLRRRLLLLHSHLAFKIDHKSACSARVVWWCEVMLELFLRCACLPPMRVGKVLAMVNACHEHSEHPKLNWKAMNEWIELDNHQQEETKKKTKGKEQRTLHAPSLPLKNWIKFNCKLERTNV